MQATEGTEMKCVAHLFREKLINKGEDKYLSVLSWFSL